MLWIVAAFLQLSCNKFGNAPGQDSRARNGFDNRSEEIERADSEAVDNNLVKMKLIKTVETYKWKNKLLNHAKIFQN